MGLSGKSCACGRPAERAIGPDGYVDEFCVRCAVAQNDALVVQLSKGCGLCGATDEPLELVGEVRACRTCRGKRKAVEG